MRLSFLKSIVRSPLANCFKSVHILIAVFFFQHAFSVQAASLDNIDSEIEKANQILKTAGSESRSSASERAAALTAAIERLHAVLESVEKVPELTTEQREAKSSEVLALI